MRLALQRSLAIARLPRPVRRFLRDARALAVSLDDSFTLASSSRPGNLRTLLELAKGRQTVVELGTAAAWTSAALVLCDVSRRVVTFDPVVYPERARYLALLPDSAAARIEQHAVAGVEGAGLVDGVELLFIDSTHEREPTVAEFRAWWPRLAPGAVVIFDDYGHEDFPGVAEAVAELGLDGEVRGSLFVTRL